MNEVKYKFARSSSSNKIVAIGAVLESEYGRKDRYICIECEKRLIPVIGIERQLHFRHEAGFQCSRESYLHKLGKEFFYQTFLECIQSNISFELELPITQLCETCRSFEYDTECRVETRKVIDLARQYPHIFLEQNDDEFRPDLLLVSERGQKIYVEVAVTHKSTEKKRDHGISLIEISISDESDLDLIRQKKLRKSKNVELLHFPHEIVVENKPSPDHCQFPFFLVGSNGLCWVDYYSPSGVQSDLEARELLFADYFPERNNYNYFYELRTAYSKVGKRIRNCFLCRYHGQNNQAFRFSTSYPIFCKINKATYGPDNAVNCGKYYPDPEMFPHRNERDRNLKCFL